MTILDVTVNHRLIVWGAVEVGLLLWLLLGLRRRS